MRLIMSERDARGPEEHERFPWGSRRNTWSYVAITRFIVGGMIQYRLHYFPESGNSYKLALMLTLCGQTFEPVWTDFGGGVTRTPAWRATVNPMGEIPVLEDGSERLTQTAPILLRLAERYGRFGGADEAERFEILRWLFWDNH